MVSEEEERIVARIYEYGILVGVVYFFIELLFGPKLHADEYIGRPKVLLMFIGSLIVWYMVHVGNRDL